MNAISIIATCFAGYIFFCLANICILVQFSGIDANIEKLQFMKRLWLSDSLFTTFNSICIYEYVNKINWSNAFVVVFVPLFNIVWFAVNVHRLIKFYKHIF